MTESLYRIHLTVRMNPRELKLLKMEKMFPIQLTVTIRWVEYPAFRCKQEIIQACKVMKWTALAD